MVSMRLLWLCFTDLARQGFPLSSISAVYLSSVYLYCGVCSSSRHLGDISAGIVMAVSNIATGVLAVIVGWITIRQIKKQYGI